MKTTKKIVAADIGGTNCRFAVFLVGEEGDLLLSKDVIFNTTDSHSFDDLLANLEGSDLGNATEDCDVLVVAVPGPVEEGRRARLANVRWDLDIDQLKEKWSMSNICVINDFVAQAYASLTPAVDDAIRILLGDFNFVKTIAVIGAGTGLGHCALKCTDHDGVVPIPSEGGHMVFPFVGEEEMKYQSFLRRSIKTDFPTGDQVVSGSGLSMIHRYLTNEDLTPKEVAGRVEADSDTIQWFSRFYGRACRNFALAVLPLGGLLVTGGVASKNPIIVDSDVFRREFVNSPGKGYLLRQVPVSLNINAKAGLWGAAYWGLNEIGKRSRPSRRGG